MSYPHTPAPAAYSMVHITGKPGRLSYQAFAILGEVDARLTIERATGAVIAVILDGTSEIAMATPAADKLLNR